MKKLYTLVVFALLSATTMMAQNVVLGDFEDGELGIWNETWGGTVTVVDNPNTDNLVNTTAKVLKYEPTGTYQAIKAWQTDIVAGDYVSANIDVYMEVAGDIQFVLGNSVSEGPGYSKTLSAPAAAWTTLSFDLSTLTIRDFQQMAFQNVANQIIFFDNITLVAGELADLDPDIQPLNDFEDGAIDGWNSWQATATIAVIDNPVPVTDVNTSAKVASLTSTESWGSFAKWFGDAGFAVTKPDALKVMVYASVATQIKIQIDNPHDAENTNHEAYKNIDAETWTLLEYDLSGLTDYGYKQLAFQPEHAGTFYFDNIQLVKATTTSARRPKAEDKSSVFTSVNGITITNCAQREVTIYNINGAKIYAQKAASSTITVNVPKGIYIVMVDQIPTKAIVK